MQFKQEIRNVVSYGSFRRKIDCMLREYVLPHLAKHRPNVVVFNEDVGLMTLATGSRGASARATFGNPDSLPDCGFEGCAALAALQAIGAAYARAGLGVRISLPGNGSAR